MSELNHTSYMLGYTDGRVVGYTDGRDENMQRLYDWLMDENREPANTKFTAGKMRNVAREIEFILKDAQRG